MSDLARMVQEKEQELELVGAAWVPFEVGTAVEDGYKYSARLLSPFYHTLVRYADM